MSGRPDAEALAALRAGRLAEALPLARRAVAGQPSLRPAHGLLALILARLGEQAAAETAIAEAETLPEGSAEAAASLAFAALETAAHDAASRLYHRAAAIAPGDPRHLYDLATSERSFGRLEAAESCCDRAIAADPTHVQSHLLRAELAVQQGARNHVGELEALAARMAGDDRATMFLGYALGKELDDLGRFDEAFAWFARASAARRRHLAYDVAADIAKLARIRACFADPVASPLPVRARHVFIVGLPRSGTTLLERILASLPDVRSNGESERFSRALLGAAPAGNGDVFARAARADWAQCGRDYARAAGDGLTVIEKLPLNALYAGAIRRALPDAVVVHVGRAPIDSGFAQFRTLFAAAYPYSYSLPELARYMGAHAALMEHWRRTLGAGLMEVTYEDLVRTPEVTVSAVARACGLEWRAEALQVERHGAVSLTASAAQVRRPIYGTSSGRWRHYRQHLTSFAAMLRGEGLEVPDGL